MWYQFFRVWFMYLGLYVESCEWLHLVPTYFILVQIRPRRSERSWPSSRSPSRFPRGKISRRPRPASPWAPSSPWRASIQTPSPWRKQTWPWPRSPSSPPSWLVAKPVYTSKKFFKKIVCKLPKMSVTHNSTAFYFLGIGNHDISRVAYRPRKSTYPMISVDEALKIVLEHAQPLGAEEIGLRGCFKIRF